MLGPMSLALRLTDGNDRLDAHAFRALLALALARAGEAMVVCDEDDEVLFACPRSLKLLERLGSASGGLPDDVRAALGAWRDAGEQTFERRLSAKGGAVRVRIAAPWAIPRVRAVVWLREECRRDDRLYAALNERYGLSRRAFQLALLVRQGLTNREIARELRLSEATVKVYLHHLYRACGVPSRTALVALMERAREPA